MTTPITCPACNDTCAVPTPVDACVFFHECECCGALLRPNAGDCCVLCSFGTRLCPPRREETKRGRA